MLLQRHDVDGKIPTELQMNIWANRPQAPLEYQLTRVGVLLFLHRIAIIVSFPITLFFPLLISGIE